MRSNVVSIEDVQVAAQMDEMWSRESQRQQTSDSFQNFAAKLGLGTDNLSSFSTYGFNPITRIRTLLEWMYRGSWLAGRVIDVVAKDMTRGGIDISGDIDPKQLEKLKKAVIRLKLWSKVADSIRWERLYGGCLAVMLIDGQDFSTPFRLESISKGKFKGLLVLDRWMVEPTMGDIITAYGPDMGLPKYYNVTATAPGLVNAKIHHSRCIRFGGVVLPWWQQVMENLWGISVIERLYDRMVAFDSATQGAAQLVYKAYIRTYSINGLRQVVAAGGKQLDGLTRYVDMMRRFQSIEGITLLDADDKFEATTTSFAGLADALNQFGQQLSGATGIPLVRLFGQSPAGFNTGETDLRNYYDLIRQDQEDLRNPVTTLYEVTARSEGIQLDDSFSFEFNSLWQLDRVQQADVASKTVDTVSKLFETGIIGRDVALKDIRQTSKFTGIGTNITDEHIKEAENEPPPLPEGVEEAEVRAEGSEETAQIKAQKDRRVPTKDSSRAYKLAWYHDLAAVVENPEGSFRRGRNWEATMPADYGYLRGVTGADGDQLDCFIGTSPESPVVFLADMLKRHSDEFDEHKVMLGYASEDSATEDLNLAYPNGGPRIGIMNQMSMQDFKRWLVEGDKTKPFSPEWEERWTS